MRRVSTKPAAGLVESPGCCCSSDLTRTKWHAQMSLTLQVPLESSRWRQRALQRASDEGASSVCSLEEAGRVQRVRYCKVDAPEVLTTEMIIEE
ncbi:uncharacterized protein IUM83_15779 [Phytophthora cinnamomi]|uniref:uncharacterized protein n=1 Tax=Phytophthora cinnamomi TaxID=4785 RepID=UPI003559873B|nr:hypothetical protein IUM83_15779 [Phytophthora cinnamomi]